MIVVSLDVDLSLTRNKWRLYCQMDGWMESGCDG